MTTNAQVVQLFTDVLTRWNEREAEFRDWQAGTAEGGPNADGRYPLTNGSNETYLVASPAKLASTVSGPAVLSEAAKVAAEAAQSASETASTQSNNSRLLAENFKNATLAARDLALLYRDQCAAAQATVATLLASTQASEANVTTMKNTVVTLHGETLTARDEAVVAKNQAQASATAAATFDPANFYTKTAADGRYLQTANFTWTNLTGKPSTFAPSAHSHVIADVTGLQTALNGKQASGSYVTTANFTWTSLTGKPTTFAPSAHSHVIADVTGLQTALDGKQASLGFTPAGTNAPTFTSGVTVNNGSSQVQIGFDGNLEIIRNLGGAYIDFKDTGSEDFDVRVQAEGNKLNVAASGGFTVSGNLGVGTSTPQGLCHLVAGTNSSLLLRGPINLGTGGSIYAVNSANSAVTPMEFGASAYYFAGGNVGFGTTAPTFKLVAANNDFDGVGLGSSGTYSFVTLGGYFSGTAGAAQIGFERSTGAFVFGNGTRDTPTERMRIASDGAITANGLGVPRWTTSGQTSANMTVSTASPSGGSDGDIWYKVAT